MARTIDWPAVAAALAERVPQDRLHPRVLAWTEAQRRSRRAWLAGVSGGADSVALLLLLWAHWPERRPRLTVVHFNHRLRGRAAAGDARFVASLAAALGVAVEQGEWTQAPRRASEAQARAARGAYFSQVVKRTRAGAVWLGHQQDDVAETVLMRVARGSGTAGLAAPRPAQSRPDGAVALRPLLTLSKAELVKALQAAGAVWREDASNASDDHFRNRLRHHVLPAWVHASGRDALAGAALSRERLDEDDEALEQWLDALAPLNQVGDLDLSILTGKPTAIWRRALHRWLLRHPHGSDLSRHGFEELLSKIRAGAATRFSLGTQAFAQIRSGRLVFQEGKTRSVRRGR
jgi:tRNA(Ile)-lysidine synthase